MICWADSLLLTHRSLAESKSQDIIEMTSAREREAILNMSLVPSALSSPFGEFGLRRHCTT